MGGDMDNWCFPSEAIGSRTLVLMGRTGNGKSATGNSILGRKVFTSKRSLSGVTDSSECHNTTLPNGEVVNVIDTPGLFDFSVGNEIIRREILKCIELAKDGVDAILLVFSIRSRFTEEEGAAFESLRTFFGPKIIEYIIVVFTGGDELDEGDSLNGFLERGSDHLKKILALCKHRVVLFYNRTDDQVKKEYQLEKLFSLVDAVMENNGQPYSDELFKEIREAAMEKLKQEKQAKALEGRTEPELVELLKKIQISCDEKINNLQEKVESMLEEIQMLKEQLNEEKDAREKAKKVAHKALKKSKNEVRKLKQYLEAQGNWWGNLCLIL